MLTGITRAIDELGRIVIPSEWRKDLKITPGNIVQISKKGDSLIIRIIEENENATGILKKVDGLGRVVVPAEWRKELEIDKETPIEMSRIGKDIKLIVKEEVCCICKTKPSDNQVTLRLYEKIICGSCKKKISEC